jgi:tetratricopeptide (TPR) repeat protein
MFSSDWYDVAIARGQISESRPAFTLHARLSQAYHRLRDAYVRQAADFLDFKIFYGEISSFESLARKHAKALGDLFKHRKKELKQLMEQLDEESLFNDGVVNMAIDDATQEFFVSSIDSPAVPGILRNPEYSKSKIAFIHKSGVAYIILPEYQETLNFQYQHIHNQISRYPEVFDVSFFTQCRIPGNLCFLAAPLSIAVPTDELKFITSHQTHQLMIDLSWAVKNEQKIDALIDCGILSTQYSNMKSKYHIAEKSGDKKLLLYPRVTENSDISVDPAVEDILLAAVTALDDQGLSSLDVNDLLIKPFAEKLNIFCDPFKYLYRLLTVKANILPNTRYLVNLEIFTRVLMDVLDLEHPSVQTQIDSSLGFFRQEESLNDSAPVMVRKFFDILYNKYHMSPFNKEPVIPSAKQILAHAELLSSSQRNSLVLFPIPWKSHLQGDDLISKLVFCSSLRLDKDIYLAQLAAVAAKTFPKEASHILTHEFLLPDAWNTAPFEAKLGYVLTRITKDELLMCVKFDKSVDDIKIAIEVARILYEVFDDHNSSQSILERVSDLATDVFGLVHLYTISCHIRLAQCHQKSLNLTDAKNLYLLAIKSLELLLRSSEDVKKYQGFCYDQLAKIVFIQDDWVKSIEYIDKAIQYYHSVPSSEIHVINLLYMKCQVFCKKREITAWRSAAQELVGIIEGFGVLEERKSDLLFCYGEVLVSSASEMPENSMRDVCDIVNGSLLRNSESVSMARKSVKGVDDRNRERNSFLKVYSDREENFGEFLMLEHYPEEFQKIVAEFMESNLTVDLWWNELVRRGVEELMSEKKEIQGKIRAIMKVVWNLE